MTGSEREWAEAEIDRAGSSSEVLGALFANLVDRFGSHAASELWWTVFGASDASET